MVLVMKAVSTLHKMASGLVAGQCTNERALGQFNGHENLMMLIHRFVNLSLVCAWAIIIILYVFIVIIIKHTPLATLHQLSDH